MKENHASNHRSGLATKIKLLWKRMKVDLTEPSLASDIGDYKENFERAVLFTKTCGFNVAFHQTSWRDENLLGKEGECIALALGNAGIFDASTSAGQCLKWCHYLAPFLEETLHCKVWPTVGQIWKNDTKVYSPSWTDLRRWVDSGIQLQDFEGRKGINVHAWLTLDTGEIIEPSFMSSLAAANPEDFGFLKGGFAWGREPAVLNEHRYFPMAVGREYFEQISAKSIAPLLASNLNELNTPMAAIFIIPA